MGCCLDHQFPFRPCIPAADRLVDPPPNSQLLAAVSAALSEYAARPDAKMLPLGLVFSVDGGDNASVIAAAERVAEVARTHSSTALARILEVRCCAAMSSHALPLAAAAAAHWLKRCGPGTTQTWDTASASIVAENLTQGGGRADLGPYTCPAVIGGRTSGATLAAARALAPTELPFITLTATSNALTPRSAFPWVVRLVRRSLCCNDLCWMHA